MARPFDRRAFLKASAGLGLGAPFLVGAAGPSDFQIGQLVTRGTWNVRPNALRRLLWEVAQRTSIEVSLEPAAVAPADDGLFRRPFLYWSGQGAVPAFSEEEVRRLRRHLTYGGMILIDSADAQPGGVFDVSVRRELARILPRQDLVKIPNDHVIYKSFYLVDHQAGRTLAAPYLEGVQIEKRYAVVYSQNDLAGAWSRDAFGRWDFDVGERQREMAFRLGINLVMYALCLDYKDDLVHLKFILKRRQ